MRRTMLATAFTLLAACTVGPDYRRPDQEPGPAWRNATASAPGNDPWWLAFRDPTLDRLEEEALAHNLELDQAIARIEQARGALSGADAALLPRGEFDAAAARVEQSLDSGLGQLSRYVPGLPRTVDNGQLSISANWEIDFAGGLRRARESARAQAQATEANLEAARIAISAEVADAYWTLRGTRLQSDALSRLIGLQQAQVDFVDARVRTGDAAAQASMRSRAVLEGLAAQAPALDALVEGERNRIAVLLARDPSARFADLDVSASIPDAPDPAAGYPGDILRRRPDVQAAEDRLIAANADIGTAIAEYYPKVTLTGLIGQVSNRLGTLTSGNATTAQGVIGLRWRLFDFGRIDADVRIARGHEREARSAYRLAVLRAAESIETAFAQLAAARSRLERQSAQRDALASALESDRRSARVGEISREAFVTTQQSVARADIDVASARQDVARATVACARALGGPTRVVVSARVPPG